MKFKMNKAQLAIWLANKELKANLMEHIMLYLDKAGIMYVPNKDNTSLYVGAKRISTHRKTNSYYAMDSGLVLMPAWTKEEAIAKVKKYLNV